MYRDKNGHGREHSEGPTSLSPSLISIDPYVSNVGVSNMGCQGTWPACVFPATHKKKGANYI